MVASVREDPGKRAEIDVVNRRGVSSTVPLDDVMVAKVFE